MAVTVEEHIATVNDNPYFVITSDKFNHAFKVEKSFDGFVFWKISITKGNLPKELTSLYTRSDQAIKAVKDYEQHAQKSKTVERDEKTQRREAQKAEEKAEV